jgi:hypothetical protein
MKWELNKRTMQMEQKRQSGVEVTARMGGIMVEDHDKNIQFLINYGTSKITHCFGCRPENIHLFDDNKSRKIAERVRRIGTGKGLDESFFDYRRYSINNKDFGNANEGKYVKSFDEVVNEGRERCYVFTFIDMDGNELSASFYDVDETGAYNQLLDIYDVQEVIDTEIE